MKVNSKKRISHLNCDGLQFSLHTYKGHGAVKYSIEAAKIDLLILFPSLWHQNQKNGSK